MIAINSRLIILGAAYLLVLCLKNPAAESHLVTLNRDDANFLRLEGSDECSLCLDVLDGMRDRTKRSGRIIGIRPVKQTLRFGKRDGDLDGIELVEPMQSDSVDLYDLPPQIDNVNNIKRAQVKQTLRFGKRNDLGGKSKMRLVKQTLRFGRSESADQSAVEGGEICSDESCLVKI